MTENIYKTPQADLETKSDIKGSPVKAILLATVVDIVGTVLVGITLTFIYSFMLASKGVKQEEILSKLQNLDLYSPLSITGIVLGAGITVYAGYLCAKKVNYLEYKWILIFCIISVLIGLVMGGSRYSAAEMFALNGLSIASAYLGAWLHVRKKV